MSAPFPYTGDLRLFMRDVEGVYMLNWPVKRKYDDFKRPGPRTKASVLNLVTLDEYNVRHQLETLYHASAEVRTQPVGFDRLDLQVYWNLRNLFLNESSAIPLSIEARADAVKMLNEYVGKDELAYGVARRVAAEFSIAPEQAADLIHQAIWHRELRVDLFRPVLMTKPLHPEHTDVLTFYGDWFAR